MEKWIRGLSKTTALIIGTVSLIFTLLIVGAIFTMNFSGTGFIPIIIACTVMGGVIGGGGGISLPLIVKGITGQTPQEKKESQQKNNPV